VKYNINKSRSKNLPWTNRWYTILLLLIIFALSSRAAWHSYSRKLTSRDAALEKNEELKKLEERKAFLSEELRKIDTAGGREAVLREDFGVGRPDEQLAIIVEAKPDEKISEAGNKIWSSVKIFFVELFKK
jgi:hypothetical protein